VPIYEYECKKCGHLFEVIQKVSAGPIKKCEKCKGMVERLISSPAIQFKGSGWYVTDYARKGSGSDGESSSESESSSSSDKKATDKKKAKTDTSKSKSSK
jgi:putative FmdB family regulatory protein